MIEKLKITITNKKKEKEERGEEGSKGRKPGTGLSHSVCFLTPGNGTFQR